MLVSEIIGNIGADAEIKDFGGKEYVSFSVAHSEYGKNKQGNRTEQTVWISVLWYVNGGGLLQYLKKGTKVFIRGRQRVKLYADKSGNAQVAININASEVVLCGAKNDNNNQGGGIPMSTPAQQGSGQDDDLPF